jgi:predicted nucleic acid-binding protein
VRVELLRALRRARVREEVTAEANVYLASLHLLRLEAGTLERAARIGPAELRMLDAVHLATALEFSRVPVTFLCYEQRLAAGARAHGLVVVTPGLDEVHRP